ncbi:MAG: hypothetical protein P1Q69_03380 [Candidatus Thorarchaeota archaeon]|nr:hypothetical protein [Candidatus Thorarchaeota archaeon]
MNVSSTFIIDGNGVITNTSVLPVGTYSLRVFVNDTYGQTINASFIIFVEDTTEPWWIDAPSDKYSELGDFFYFDLNASDFSGIDSWTINNTDFSIGLSDGIIRNDTTLSVGNYTLETVVFDDWGWNTTAIFVVTVDDRTNPDWIIFPSDQELEFGNPFRYDVNASDLSEIHTWWLNSSDFLVEQGRITNNTSLQVQEYVLRIWLNDTWNNYIFADITITVIDSTDPIWVTTTAEEKFELGDDVSFLFVAFDLSPIQWTVNDTDFLISGGLLTNISALDIGSYPLNVTVTDDHGNCDFTILTIIIEDSTAPSYSGLPVNQILELGDSLNYALDASDLSGEITWWISDSVNFSIDAGRITNRVPLVVGIYNLTIGISDSSENTAYAPFSVTVRDTTPPTWSTTPQDTTIFYGSHLTYQLVADDESDIALWTVNDTRFTINSNGLLEDVDTLPVGEYPLNITVYDEYDNSRFVILKITVREIPVTTTIPPEIIALAIVVIVGTGVVSVFVLYRLKKVEKKSSVPKEGKEDLGTALDYLDEIQDDIKPDDEN